MATKRLARQLGILRRSSKSSPVGQSHSKPKQRQEFDYLIIIDFESTCWRDSRKHYSQEIIEFPAVLLNTSNGEIETEFHMYVQPQEHPILSEFCTELTGITQNQVDEGVPLPICLSQFSKWIQKIQKEKNIVFGSVCSNTAASAGKLCAFVTWSDWDLGVCLLYECKRKQLRKPEILNSWIDLRATYKVFYSRKPQGLNGALQDVGILFAGREHSGLDDSRNTARLAWRMICDGCVMKITKSLDKVFPAKNSIARFLSAKPSEGHTLGSTDGAKAPDLDKSGYAEGPAVIQNDAGEEQQGYMPVSLYGRNPVTSGNGSKPTSRGSVRNCTTPRRDRLGSPVGRFQTSFGIEIGLINRHLTANSPGQNAGLVLVSTTLSSVNTSDTDVGTTSDCLSMLGDWEDFALIPDSQQSSERVQVEDADFDTMCSPISGGRTDTGELSATSLRSESASEITLNVGLSESVVYKSPSTTIYHKNTASSKCSDASVFKLPAAKTNTASVMLNGDCFGSSSSSEAPKRKPSSPRPVPPAKKPPFIVYEDKRASPGNSFRSSASHRVPFGVLNSSINQNRASRRIETGKVTPPLCKCGRRARRLQVSNGGPNHGKAFYSCPVGKQEGPRKGCGYFKWAYTLLKEKCMLPSTTAGTVGLPSPGTSLHSPGSVPEKCRGLRPSMRT